MEPPLSSQPEWRITTTGRPASHFEISCPFRKPSCIDLQTVLRRARPADRETPSTERLVTWTFHEERVNRTDHPQSRIVPFRENGLATVAVLETHSVSTCVKHSAIAPLLTYHDWRCSRTWRYPTATFVPLLSEFPNQSEGPVSIVPKMIACLSSQWSTYIQIDIELPATPERSSTRR